jgi:hypothetical protein
MSYLKSLIYQKKLSDALSFAEYRLKQQQKRHTLLGEDKLHHMMKDVSLLLFLLEKQLRLKNTQYKTHQLLKLIQRAKKLEIQVGELGYVFTL